MNIELSCERARIESSARLDGEATAAIVKALDEHLRTCAECRRHEEHLARIRSAVRLQPAERGPDLTSAIMARVAAEGDRARRRDDWTVRWRVAATAAAAAALVLVSSSLPFSSRPPSSATAAEIESGVRLAARNLSAYRATFNIVERGFNSEVPVRRFVAHVVYEAPEKIRVGIKDLTTYPKPDLWPINDVDLVANPDRWWLREPSTCPITLLPRCGVAGDQDEESVVHRPPFDGTTPLPTDIILPLETIASSEGLAVLGSDTIDGRTTFHIALPYRQARP